MAARHTFDDAKRWLRKRFPLEYAVRVRLVSRGEIAKHCPDSVGYALFSHDGCEIGIDKSAGQDSKIEHLHEEWAHLLRWHLPLLSDKGDNEHDDIYYLIFGRIKRAWND